MENIKLHFVVHVSGKYEDIEALNFMKRHIQKTLKEAQAHTYTGKKFRGEIHVIKVGEIKI